MELKIRVLRDFQVIALAGDLSLYALPIVSHWLDTVLGKQEADVALDLSELEFIDSSGIAAILRWRKLVVDGGGRFVLLAVPEDLMRMFELARLHQHLDFRNSEADLERD